MNKQSMIQETLNIFDEQMKNINSDNIDIYDELKKSSNKMNTINKYIQKCGYMIKIAMEDIEASEKMDGEDLDRLFRFMTITMQYYLYIAGMLVAYEATENKIKEQMMERYYSKKFHDYEEDRAVVWGDTYNTAHSDLVNCLLAALHEVVSMEE